MKATVFEKLIRRVVREEIDYALRREIKTLKEDLHDEFKSTIIEQPTQQRSEMSTPIPSSVRSSLKEKIIGKQISHNFASNNTLNDLLNETAQGNTNTESTLTQSQPIPASIENVVNRDYRELMRAIDAKKK